jgi:hypothetical protein
MKGAILSLPHMPSWHVHGLPSPTHHHYMSLMDLKLRECMLRATLQLKAHHQHRGSSRATRGEDARIVLEALNYSFRNP